MKMKKIYSNIIQSLLLKQILLEKKTIILQFSKYIE